MRFLAGMICGIALLSGTQAHSQDYPNKPIRILVPFAPGGVVDVAARIVGQKLSETGASRSWSTTVPAAMASSR